jgi:perosamine synthetase
MSDSPTFIPFGRPAFGDEEIAAVSAVLRSGWVGMGDQTIAFEHELAAFLEAPHVVTVSSCTGALFLALLAAGVREGDEVICPSLTWCSTANASLYLGARPVFCDIDAASLAVTPETILASVTPRTRAVAVVHYGGFAVDVDALRLVLPSHIAIVEDAAHALGARYPNGRPVGSSGNLVCFSFYANKNLSTGEGGAIALADGVVAERLRSLRQHGMPSNAWTRYVSPTNWNDGARLDELGYKLNFTDLQASIGRVQLKRQAEFHERRLGIARAYADFLGSCLSDARLQTLITSDRHARHLFVVRLDDHLARVPRKDLIQRARARGVGLSVHYAPLHRMPLYDWTGTLPVTDALADRLVTLPISASMTDADAERVTTVFVEQVTELALESSRTATRRVAGAIAFTPVAPDGRYGFGGRLAARFPSQILVDVSEVCNLACVHCPHPEFKASEHYGKRQLDPALNDKLVDEVRAHGAGSTQYIRYASNGEPLGHPHILDMLDAATSRSGVAVTLTTNGTLLTEARAERMVASGVHVVDISIDALLPETYAAIRVGGNLKKVEANVARLIDLASQGGGRTRVVVSFVEQPQNRSEIDQFERVWRDRGAADVVIRRLHSCSGAKSGLAVERRAAVRDADRTPCLYPWERIGLNAAGHLFFCPSDWVHGSTLADYRETTIENTWRGDAYRALREAHLTNDYSRHAFCGQCPDWAATRWPHPPSRRSRRSSRRFGKRRRPSRAGLLSSSSWPSSLWVCLPRSVAT